jgi:hypothetical protein
MNGGVESGLKPRAAGRAAQTRDVWRRTLTGASHHLLPAQKPEPDTSSFLGKWLFSRRQFKETRMSLSCRHARNTPDLNSAGPTTLELRPHNPGSYRVDRAGKQVCLLHPLGRTAGLRHGNGYECWGHRPDDDRTFQSRASPGTSSICRNCHEVVMHCPSFQFSSELGPCHRERQ